MTLPTLAEQYAAIVAKSPALARTISIIEPEEYGLSYSGPAYMCKHYIAERDGKFYLVDDEPAGTPFDKVDLDACDSFDSLEELAIFHIQTLRFMTHHKEDIGRGEERFDLILATSSDTGSGMVWEVFTDSGVAAEGTCYGRAITVDWCERGVKRKLLKPFINAELARMDV